MTPTHAELEEQKKTLAIDTTPLSDSFLAMIKKTKTTELMDQQDKLVEIGAGTCIDRGSGPNTVIGEIGRAHV